MKADSSFDNCYKDLYTLVSGELTPDKLSFYR